MIVSLVSDFVYDFDTRPADQSILKESAVRWEG